MQLRAESVYARLGGSIEEMGKGCDAPSLMGGETVYAGLGEEACGCYILT